VFGFEVSLRRGVEQFRAGLTERPVSPREAIRGGPAKKGRGNKRALDALLIRCEHVKHWMEDSAKLHEEVEPGKQSGITCPACPCRAVGQ
jgi:hypothetical protein